MNKDLVLVTVPYTETHAPLGAIPILKSIAVREGWSTKTIDFNAELVNKIKKAKNRNAFIDFFFNEEYYPEIEKDLLDMIEYMSEKILSYNPKLVGVSLFSFASQTATKYLCLSLKEKNPNLKIVIGGNGIADDTLTGNNLSIGFNFVTGLKKMKIIDDFIVGDAEHSFAVYLRGNKKSLGINTPNWQELSNDDLDNLPYPNYDDYDFSIYEKRTISINGSRGCVRKCSFCNDILHWKKFSFRSGKEIVDEMIYQSKKYNVNNFFFSDALINGSLKEFRVFIEHLAEYNRKNPNNKLSYEAQFIFRPKHQFPEESWQLLKESNPLSLGVGIENFNEDIRFDMGKKFDQASLEFGLDMALKYDIKIGGMLIVGYPTETREHIDYAKDWLEKNVRFREILDLSWGGTLAVLPGTKLDLKSKEYNLEISGPPWQNWVNTKTGLDLETRINWWKELVDHSQDLGFSRRVTEENDGMVQMMLESY